jgi:hypothetical protein
MAVGGWYPSDLRFDAVYQIYEVPVPKSNSELPFSPPESARAAQIRRAILCVGQNPGRAVWFSSNSVAIAGTRMCFDAREATRLPKCRTRRCTRIRRPAAARLVPGMRCDDLFLVLLNGELVIFADRRRLHRSDRPLSVTTRR